MLPPRERIAIENMYYGASPQRRMGQEVLGKTSGISKDAEDEIVAFCNSWGDCRNLNFRRSLNQFPMQRRSENGERLIAVVKVVNAGQDSIGREGTLVRHAVVLSESDYRPLEFNPFTLEAQGVFLSASTRQYDCRIIYLDVSRIPPSDLSDIPRLYHDPIRGYLRAILSGGEMFVFLNNHLHTAEDVIYYTFKLLPFAVRPDIALTTFAFRKNLDYRIGCYYRQSGSPPDPLKVKFEISVGDNSGIADYLEALFAELRGEKYWRVYRMLSAFAAAKK